MVSSLPNDTMRSILAMGTCCVCRLRRCISMHPRVWLKGEVLKGWQVEPAAEFTVDTL